MADGSPELRWWHASALQWCARDGHGGDIAPRPTAPRIGAPASRQVANG